MIQADRVRILVADDHAMFRDGLKRLVESEDDLHVVGEAGDATQAVNLSRELKPDVLLLDLTMPNGGGLDALRAICSGPPTATRSIMLTGDNNHRGDTIAALQLGARGIVVKTSEAVMLFRSIRAVMTGEYWVWHQKVADGVEAIRLIMANGDGASKAERYRLTARELEIVPHIAGGASNRDIAQLLWCAKTRSSGICRTSSTSSASTRGSSWRCSRSITGSSSRRRRTASASTDLSLERGDMPMKSSTLRPLVVAAAIVIACFVLGPRPSAVSHNGPAEHLAGRSLDAQGVYAGPVDIMIERWSTDEEVEKVTKPMLGKNGPGAVLAVLEKVRLRAGYVLTPGVQNSGERALLRRTWSIEFAREIKTPQGRRIVVASRDHLPIGEFPKDVALGTAHGLDVLEFRLDKLDKGVGKLADGTKVVFNKSTKMLEIAKYETEPVRLTDVGTRPLRARDVPPKQYYGAK